RASDAGVTNETICRAQEETAARPALAAKGRLSREPNLDASKIQQEALPYQLDRIGRAMTGFAVLRGSSYQVTEKPAHAPASSWLDLIY
ncbi:MAG: hypothetical protein L0312_31805, partial [Acidobacteria bacterium]|nr:hypothetical protein [Acidobacteriota bacterium]